MTDIVDEETRSRMMASIMGRNTKPEMLVRRYLHAAGLRFKLHEKRLPGSPDLAFPELKVALFVHGCFWHRHADCRFATTPKTRADFWQQKFAANVARDRRSLDALASRGWTSIVVWECELTGDSALDELYWQIRAAAQSRDRSSYSPPTPTTELSDMDDITRKHGSALKAFASATPELVTILSIVHHSRWSEFSQDYGVAAPQKLIMAEALEYIDQMGDLARTFSGLDDVCESLQALRSSLQGAEDDLLLEPNDKADEPEAARARRWEESEYVSNFKSHIHGVVDDVVNAHDSLPFDDELDELDAGGKEAVQALDLGFKHLRKVIGMLWEH